MGTHLHVVSGDDAAAVVRTALASTGEAHQVVAFHDGYVVGPLAGVDSDPGARIAWWNSIALEPLTDAQCHALDDAARWDSIRASESPVVLWHGPSPAERILALRACWHLRDQPTRVSEVALPLPPRDPPLEPFYGAVGIAGPEVAASCWANRRPVIDVAARAERWVTLRDEPGAWIRLLEGDEIVRLPLTHHDEDLIAACHGDWTKPALAVARVLSGAPVGDVLLWWRLRELLRTGHLEGRGGLMRLGLPAEIRPTR